MAVRYADPGLDLWGEADLQAEALPPIRPDRRQVQFGLEAIGAGLDTYIGMTKASLVAVIASILVGMACAYFIPVRPRET